MTNNKVDTPNAVISWDKRCFVRVACKPGVKLELDDALIFNKARKAVSPAKQHLCLFDIRQVISISREGRMHAVNQESSEITIACANLIGSPIGKMIGNIFIRINHPPYPAKLFNDEEEAIKWLLQFEPVCEEKK